MRHRFITPNSVSRESFRFFLEHAGGIVGERAIGAVRLARAEQALAIAERYGVARVEWLDDVEPYDYDPSVDPPERVAVRFESGEWTGPYGCVVWVGDDVEPRDGADPASWTANASLWGIVLGSRGTDDPYARVVAAELADELADDLAQAIGDARDAELPAELAERLAELRTFTSSTAYALTESDVRHDWETGRNRYA